MEEVVRAVVGEAEGLVQAIARQDEVLRTHQSHLADTRHALLRYVVSAKSNQPNLLCPCRRS
jgi:hypothetical protein